MKLFSFLFGVTLFSGVMRFSGISLLDEAAFLVLLCLLILFKKKNARSGPSPYINKYYSRAKASYLILFSYLILSLFFTAFYIDPYIGKLRWLVILAALLVCDNYFSFYLRSKINDANRITHIKRIYNLLSFFHNFLFPLCCPCKSFIWYFSRSYSRCTNRRMVCNMGNNGIHCINIPSIITF